MCNPVAIAAASAVFTYQQSVEAQKTQRDAQIRQNEIAAKNLENRRANLQTELIQKTTRNIQKIGKAESEYKRRRASFRAMDKGFTGNTYEGLLANYYDFEGQYRNAVLGNIATDKAQFRNDYLTANNIYDSQTTYVTNVNYAGSAINSGLQFATSYYNYKSQQELKEAINPKYTYNENIDLSE
jgi:hypothetical protein